MGLLRRTLTATAVVLASGVVLLGAEVWIAKSAQGPGPAATPPPDALAGPAGSPSDVVVWLGDSTAAGVGASGIGQSLPEQVATLIGRPVRLDVLAHSGDKVADVLHHQLPRVAAAHPTVVFISIGANDVTGLTGRGSFRRDYQRVLAGLPASVRLVVLVGVPDMGTAPRVPQPLRAIAGWRGRALESDVRHLAARTARSAYADIAGSTGHLFRSHPKQYFAADHYHPNDAGYGLWAAAVAAAVAGKF